MSESISATALQPFSGDTPTCVKCGHKGASTHHIGYGRCLHEGSVVIGYEPNDRLHRECNRCSYRWDEAVV